MRLAERFELKQEHVTLLRAMYWEWQDDENGAPGVDCKRPYGNSYILPDLAEALGRKLPPDDAEEYQDVVDELYGLHDQTGTAIMVIIQAGSFEPGVYERQQGRHAYDWKPWKRVDA
jgi:hypothetical protein